MAPRLSTAEIIAAARAADGKRPAAMPAAVSERKAEPKAESASPPPEAPAAAPLAVTPPSGVSSGTQPRETAAILRQVRQDRKPEGLAAVPHSMHDVLDAVRKDGRPAEVRPASMTTILQRVREMCGTSDAASRAVPVASAPATNTARTNTTNTASTAKRPSTAEILAAARANAKPASVAGQAKAAAKPNAKANERTQVATPVADPSDGRPRPPAMADLLSSVRSSISDRQSRIEYPSLKEMLRELRSVDQRRFGQMTSQRPPDGWIGRVKRWLTGTSDTHQGASI